MNASELATTLLKWEEKKRSLDALREVIEAAVLELEQTQTVGNVRARYSKGRRTYDYKAAIEAANVESASLRPFRIVRSHIDYGAACLDFGITDIPFTQSPPSVSVKLLS